MQSLAQKILTPAARRPADDLIASHSSGDVAWKLFRHVRVCLYLGIALYLPFLFKPQPSSVESLSLAPAVIQAAPSYSDFNFFEKLNNLIPSVDCKIKLPSYIAQLSEPHTSDALVRFGYESQSWKNVAAQNIRSAIADKKFETQVALIKADAYWYDLLNDAKNLVDF